MTGLPQRCFLCDGEDPYAVKAFMCRTAWEFESGGSSDGNRIFYTEESALEHCKCSPTCGLVELDIRVKGVAIVGSDNEESSACASRRSP